MFFAEITIDPKSQNVSAGAILATVHTLLHTASRFQTRILQATPDAKEQRRLKILPVLPERLTEFGVSLRVKKWSADMWVIRMFRSNTSGALRSAPQICEKAVKL